MRRPPRPSEQPLRTSAPCILIGVLIMAAAVSALLLSRSTDGSSSSRSSLTEEPQSLDERYQDGTSKGGDGDVDNMLDPNEQTQQFAVKIYGGQDVARKVADSLGCKFGGGVGVLENHYIFNCPASTVQSTLENNDKILWLERQTKRQHHPKRQ